jgi:ribosomal-protein-alanine N-acetyltransferase
VVIRSACEGDRAAIAAIQSVSPEASGWDPAGYDVTVADLEGEVIGFLVTRRTAADEWEVLNLAVSPAQRRRGIATSLLRPFLTSVRGWVFLELRESNLTALKLYQSLGFKELTRRSGYYQASCEGAIVMNFHSC